MGNELVNTPSPISSKRQICDTMPGSCYGGLDVRCWYEDEGLKFQNAGRNGTVSSFLKHRSPFSHCHQMTVLPQTADVLSQSSLVLRV